MYIFLVNETVPIAVKLFAVAGGILAICGLRIAVVKLFHTFCFDLKLGEKSIILDSERKITKMSCNFIVITISS